MVSFVLLRVHVSAVQSVFLHVTTCLKEASYVKKLQLSIIDSSDGC